MRRELPFFFDRYIDLTQAANSPRWTLPYSDALGTGKNIEILHCK